MNDNIANCRLPTSTFELHRSNSATALPGQRFYSTQIPVCLWFLAKNKNADDKRGFLDRLKQTLFIDARKLGTLIDRAHSPIYVNGASAIEGHHSLDAEFKSRMHGGTA
jgi:hypothetical protein